MASALFQSLVRGLVRSEAIRGALVAYDGRSARVDLGPSEALFVFDAAGGGFAGQELRERLAAVVGERQKPLLGLLVVGGGDAARAALSAALPLFAVGARHVDVFQVEPPAEPGGPLELWVRGEAMRGQVELALELAAQDLVPVLPEKAFLETLAAPRREHPEEAVGFRARILERRPTVTYVALGLIGVLFALELAFGGTEFLPTLVRMGANHRESVLEGEWWRLLSSALLHGSGSHVLMNGLVLFSLGPLFERILGHSRFLILLVAAAAAGSLASALGGRATVSVGASGAFWGLLGAMVALGFRPSALVPEPVRLAMRKAALINVALNIAISFLPRVDFLAHLGGGLAGLLLVGSGLLTRGLPAAAPGSLAPKIYAALAAVLAALTVGSSAHALYVGRPWELVDAPRFERFEPSGTGLSLEVPVLSRGPALLEPPEPLPGRREWVVGDIQRDRAVLSIVLVSLGPDADRPDGVEAEWEALVAMMGEQVPEEATPEGGVEVERKGDLRLARRSFRLPGGLVEERVFALGEGHVLLVDAVVWPGSDPAWLDVPERVAGSLAR